jgi:polysaccharide deacetylase 2 family uncharacterized protein YibQ
MRFLEILLPPEVPMAKAARALDRLAEERDHAVQVVWMKEEAGVWAADIWVDGFLTHRALLRAIPQKPKDAAPVARRPQVALIVDDLGNTYDPMRSLVDVGFPLTLAVFPRRPYSRQIASEGRSRGLEMMLHLPMEPRLYPEKDPGDGALLVDMSREELERVLLENLRDLPEVRGVNNHMGSRFTEHTDGMTAVMEVLAERGLYFVDSLTTPRSVGYHLAKKMGLQAYRRDVFLDVIQDRAEIRSQFQKLLRVARLRGYSVGICHPYPETLQVLPHLRALAIDEGYDLVTISQLRIPGG